MLTYYDYRLFEMWRGIVADRCTERPEKPDGWTFRVERTVRNAELRSTLHRSCELKTKYGAFRRNSQFFTNIIRSD
jgi:hypothetical protein